MLKEWKMLLSGWWQLILYLLIFAVLVAMSAINSAMAQSKIPTWSWNVSTVTPILRIVNA